MTFLARPNTTENMSPVSRKISIVIGSKPASSSALHSLTSPPKSAHSNLSTQEEDEIKEKNDNDYNIYVEKEEEEEDSNASSPSNSFQNSLLSDVRPDTDRDTDDKRIENIDKSTENIDKSTENRQTNSKEETNAAREWLDGKRKGFEHYKGSRSMDYLRTVGCSRQSQSQQQLSIPLTTISPANDNNGNTFLTPPLSPSSASTPTTPSMWASSAKPSPVTPRKSDPSCHRMPDFEKPKDFDIEFDHDLERELDSDKKSVQYLRSAGQRFTQGGAGTLRLPSKKSVRYQLKSGRSFEIDKNNDERSHSDTEADDKPTPRATVFDCRTISSRTSNSLSPVFSNSASNNAFTAFTQTPISPPRINNNTEKKSTLTRLFHTLKPSKMHDRPQKSDKVLPHFGLNLKEVIENQILQSHPGDIPLLLTLSIPLLRAKGLNQEGLFRVSGSFAAIDLLKTDFEQGIFTTLEVTESIHTLAGLVEKFLQDLPEPLIPYDMFDNFIHTLDEQNPSLRLSLIKTQLGHLPQINLNTLKFFVGFLHEVHSHAEVNKMTASNLGLVFGPILMNPRELERISVLILKKQSDLVTLLVEFSPTLFETF